MIERHSLSIRLALVAAAGVILGCTGTARATANAGGDPQYASPSPSPASGGDVVDKARHDAEKAGEKVKEGAEKTGEVVKDAAHDVKEKAKPVAHEVKHDAKPVAHEVGEKAKEGAHKTGEVVDATKQHLDVKSALLADKTVDASHIDVDIDKGTKTLHLRGTVPTAAQRATAERIARDKADGYFISNELTVMERPK